MHVAIYHDAVIPPGRYGGTERVIAWLARGLVERGHEVTLISRRGSRVAGANWQEALPGVPLDDQQIPSDADIVHVFSTPSRPFKRPYLVTIQGNGKPGEHFHPGTVFVSKKHAENHGSRHFVHNGLDPNEYPCEPIRGDHLVFLAKASWKVKNLAGAIEIARALRLPLEVMGSRKLPLGLNRLLPAYRGVRYRGMLDDEEKKPILRGARGLLFPVRWDEPFGVAITEALVSGAPVFGTPYGSLPEIVTPDCGVLAADADTLVNSIRSGHYSPETCRARVVAHFSHRTMTEKYLGYYRRILESGRLGDEEEPSPVAKFAVDANAETLLPWRALGR